MNFKETYQTLVQKIQNHYKENGKKITKEQIAQKLGISRTYFSALNGGSEEVKQYHIDDLRLKFKDILEGNTPPIAEVPPWPKAEAGEQAKNQMERLLEIIESQNEIIKQQQQTINHLIAAAGNVSLPPMKTGSA